MTMRPFGKVMPIHANMLQLAGFTQAWGKREFRRAASAEEFRAAVRAGRAELREATGRDFGYDLAAWRTFLAAAPDDAFGYRHSYTFERVDRAVRQATRSRERRRLVAQLEASEGERTPGTATAGPPRAKRVSKYLLAALMTAAGTAHLAAPGVFAAIVPPELPFPFAIAIASGVCEIALGGLLLVPRLSRPAAWGVVALLVAVFPANVYLYHHQELVPAPPLLHLLRLPFQGVLLLWAYWHTRPDPGRTAV